MNSNIRALKWWLLALSFFLVVLIQGCVQRKPSIVPAGDHYEAKPAAPAPGRGEVGRFRVAGGMVGGGGSGVQEAADRKVIRNAFLALLVDDVSKTTEQIEALARNYRGYVEKTEVAQAKGIPQRGHITVRIPAARLDDARSEIKRLARLVESDKTEARDVTKEFVDNEARLRNYQAEERQYLEIMRRATKVADTLNTAEHLSDVRGRIEQLQAELKYLSQQVEMASVAVDLRVESIRQSSQWQPWYQTKLAFADMVEGLIDFADSVVYFLLMLPVIALWAVALIVLIVAVIKTLAWLRRKFWPGLAMPFRRSKP
jgi:hypothetical protein